MKEREEAFVPARDPVVHYGGDWPDADRRLIEQAIHRFEHAYRQDPVVAENTWFCYSGRAGEETYFVARAASLPEVLLAESAAALADQIEKAAPSPVGTHSPLTAGSSEAPTKILFVDFRSGEETSAHPDLAPWLQQGWRVKSAAPRIMEAAGTKLLVVLTRGDEA